MKKIIRTTLAAGLAVICAAPMLLGQDRRGLNVFFGSVFPTADEPNSDALHGGGANVKYFVIKDRLALGGGIQYYGRTSAGTFFGADYELSTYVLPIHTLAEYYFSKSDNMLRPYLGADIGVYMFGVSGAINGAEFEPDPDLYFGLAPKIGIQLNISQQLGAFGELGYNIVFNKEDQSGGGLPDNADFENVATEFFALHLGIALRF